jgi:hypothetical protein
MILGLSIATFTLVHVSISRIGIATGLVVLAGMLRGKRLFGWTCIFLATTVLTTLTGFLFPITAFSWHWRRIDDHPGVRAARTLCLPPCRRVARDLRHQRRRGALRQRIRRGGAVVPVALSAAGACADPVGAAVPGRAGYRAAAVRHRRLHRGEDVRAVARLAAITRERQ